MSADLSKLLGTTRNKRSIKKPILINTELGAVANDIALKDTTIKVDPTIWANNPSAVNDAQRIAQAFGLVGKGLQDMAQGEVEEARMDYAERKQAEAEAKQAAKEAKAEAKIRDRRNAAQLVFENHNIWEDKISEASEKLLHAEGATQELHHQGMVALLPEMTAGLNQNEQDVIVPFLQDRLMKEMDRGYTHFKKINIETATKSYINAMSDQSLSAEERLMSIKLADEEAAERGLKKDEINNTRMRSWALYAANLGGEGKENELTELENFLQTNEFLDIEDTKENALQQEINKQIGIAKKARADRELTAERNSFEKTYQVIKDSEDIKQLESEMVDITQAETDGTFLSLKEKSGKISAYKQKIGELKAFSSQFEQEFKDVSDVIDAKLKQTQADGVLTSGEAGVALDLKGGSVLLMGSERRKIDQKVRENVIPWARENNIRKGDPRLYPKIYDAYSEYGGNWGLQNYDPEAVLNRTGSEYDLKFFNSNREILTQRHYKQVVEARKKGENPCVTINSNIPLTGDAQKDKDIVKIRNYLYSYVAQKDRVAQLEKMAMSEKEVANQGFAISDNDRVYLGKSGLGYYDEGMTINSDEDSIFDYIREGLSAISSATLSSRKPPEYSFQYDVPYELEEIKATDNILKENTGGKQSLKNMNIEDATKIIEQLRIESELNAQKLVNKLTSERNVALTKQNKKLAQDNKQLKNLFINGELPTKTNIRIEGINNDRTSN